MAKTARKKRIDPPHVAADETLAIDVAEMLATREKASGLYKAAGQQEESLIARMEAAGVKFLPLPNGSAATLIDNFATGNFAWKSAKCQRKEIKVVS